MEFVDYFRWDGFFTMLGVMVFGFALSVLVTRGMIRLASRYDLRAHPNERSSHIVPTPQLGGVAVALPVFVIILVFLPKYEGEYGPPLALAIGGLVFFLMGLYDDLRPFNAQAKLVGQLIAASIASFAVFQGSAAMFTGAVASAILVFWIVGFVNTVNFMDGMNGKSGSFVLISLATILFMMRIVEDTGASLLPIPRPLESAIVPIALVAAGSTGGFLVFNCRANAAIFLGDSGSHFLGFLLGAIALMTSESLYGPGRSLLVFVILFMPFLYDVTLTLIRRTIARKRIWEAHREHLYQRLIIAGMSHMEVLRICVWTYLVCAIFAVRAALADSFDGRFVYFGVALAVMVAYTAYVRHVENAS